ncbi:uncharacterized protein LOC105696856 isoform X2 [Orussus abietinus]|uniref:uncharacterized protein LOC105696856 isoform X2 n=1 Tax=Orussus abietinus TaxID=222816 RepID=UPI0006263496|nr:uncharacterized protein LOC105696856 isoform X2 [Orussus abietinus]
MTQFTQSKQTSGIKEMAGSDPKLAQCKILSSNLQQAFSPRVYSEREWANVSDRRCRTHCLRKGKYAHWNCYVTFDIKKSINWYYVFISAKQIKNESRQGSRKFRLGNSRIP